MESLKGRKALITGASSGIGAALARCLAAEGVDLGLVARRGDRLEEVARWARGFGVAAIGLTADVTRLQQVEQAVKTFLKEMGPPDMLFLNAGVGVFVPAYTVDAGQVLGVMEVNFNGAVHVLSAVLPEMLKRGSGHVVATSSLAAPRALPGFGAYSASKAALERLIEGLRGELGPRGIDFTTVAPGFVRTDMTARNRFFMPFLMEPDEVARRVVEAVRTKKVKIAFPWPMAAAVKLAGLVPDRIYDGLLKLLPMGASTSKRRQE